MGGEGGRERRRETIPVTHVCLFVVVLKVKSHQRPLLFGSLYYPPRCPPSVSFQTASLQSLPLVFSLLLLKLLGFLIAFTVLSFTLIAIFGIGLQKSTGDFSLHTHTTQAPTGRVGRGGIVGSFVIN